MLIISRKVDESIVLDCPDGSRIEVIVTDIRRAGGQRPYAKLGIAAPKAVVVRRNELLDDAHVFTEGSDGDGATANT